MFTSTTQEPVSFPSSWKTEQNNAENSTQTDPVPTKDQQNQVASTSESGVQTDEEQKTIPKDVEFNDFKILAFLQRITPRVEKELRKTTRSRAFDGFSLTEEESIVEPKLRHTLRIRSIPEEHAVLGIDWSATGSLIGVCYGVPIHDDWCNHKGSLAVWNLNRSELSTTCPEFVAEVSTCATCLAFHPSEPAIVALGSVAGEVMTYDLSRSESAAAPWLMTDTEGSAVTCLRWAPVPPSGPQSPHLQTPMSLVGITSDGAVLVWLVHRSKGVISLSSGFIVKSEDIPRESRLRLNDSRGVALTDVSFSFEDASRFLLGTEAGAVLVCSALLVERSGEAFGKVDLNKCVTSSLTPHTGRVSSVATSKFHHHAALSIGSDNTLKLHSLLQPNRPVRTIFSEEAMTCGLWVPSRPLVGCVGKENGSVAFFNFASTDYEPILSLTPADKVSPISSLALNKTNIKLLASGDHLGRVFVWEIPEHIVSPSAAEHSTLASLVQVAVE